MVGGSQRAIPSGRRRLRAGQPAHLIRIRVRFEFQSLFQIYNPSTPPTPQTLKLTAMKTKKPPTIVYGTYRRPDGFTLLELLVVVMIISILAGLSFGALSAVRRLGDKTKAKNQVAQIALAVENYFQEYGKYPISGGAGSDVTQETDRGFMAILMGFDEEMNPRSTTYIEPRAATNDKGGLISNGGGPGDYVDPWGKRFMVLMDGNYDKQIDNPNPSGESRTLFQRVLVWSTGLDRDEDATKSKKGDFWADNVTNFGG